jgi:hypothetical protein
VEVAQAAAEQEPAAEAQPIGGEDPLRLDRRRAELALQRRQRDGDRQPVGADEEVSGAGDGDA